MAMKNIVVFLVLFVSANALLCDLCGRGCCSSWFCSKYCRELGKNGGYCSYNSREDRCICYCYNDVTKAENLPGYIEGLLKMIKELELMPKNAQPHGTDRFLEKAKNKMEEMKNQN